MVDEKNILELLGAFMMAIIGYFTKRTVDEVRQTSKEVSEYKLHAAQHYASRGETQHSLDRIHSRMDDITRSVDSKFDTISTDIKQILHKLPKQD